VRRAITRTRTGPAVAGAKPATTLSTLLARTSTTGSPVLSPSELRLAASARGSLEQLGRGGRLIAAGVHRRAVPEQPRRLLEVAIVVENSHQLLW
jgi:hypothetical protein